MKLNWLLIPTTVIIAFAWHSNTRIGSTIIENWSEECAVIAAVIRSERSRFYEDEIAVTRVSETTFVPHFIRPVIQTAEGFAYQQAFADFLSAPEHAELSLEQRVYAAIEQLRDHPGYDDANPDPVELVPALVQALQIAPDNPILCNPERLGQNVSLFDRSTGLETFADGSVHDNGLFMHSEEGHYELQRPELRKSELRVSPIGFTADYSTALLEVGYYCGSWCGSGSFYLLEKDKNGVWQVTGTGHTWIA
jgi:hypothetical protein